MSEVTCKTCKYAFRKLSSILIWGSGAEWKCQKMWVEEKREFDPIKGAKIKPAHYADCMSARASYNDSPCGKEGRLWEPRDKKDFFVYLKKI